MSLIHEALKKAEQQRRLGQPPDLGTPFASTRRPRSSLPYLAAGIVVALGAGWWLASDGPAPAGSGADGKPAAAGTAAARTADNPAAGSVATPAAPGAAGEPVASSSATTRRPVMGANAQANTNVADSLVPPPRLNNQAPPAGTNPPTVKEVAERESEPHPPGANPLAPGEAAPLALGAPPPPTEVNDAAGLAAKMAVKERERGGLAAAPPAADPARSPRKPGPPPGSLAEANAPPPNLAGANAPPKTTTTASATAKTPAAPPSLPPPNPPPATAKSGIPPAAAAAASAAPATAPGLEQLPAYWQLPYNMRKELPALKLSMHVYSATPTQRFVVLNGNRQVEGDELGGDVKVTEIRSDGVVLTYQGQRFLVPRGGS